MYSAEYSLVIVAVGGFDGTAKLTHRKFWLELSLSCKFHTLLEYFRLKFSLNVFRFYGESSLKISLTLN